ncbi:hypothetical protein [Flavobacterium aciduliphilum]|uniref:Parallel beta helix pectate lyase-like protein n=1 Tax=Flavobacterium aciduliphilum TaxID=1101402 RepID=A0A328YIF6_9FLAO|nr:hypothetical protein [Flavobacterium aciduliphilum]RAR70016.1 hypothetical protein CLV55_1135 [Flavobacterium aciduliphilum]
MRNLLFVLFIGLCVSLTSCRNDFAFEPSTGGLEFSKDTVYLDTVFTNIASSTYRLKVYNRTNKDISIPKIQLGKGLNSKYRIMVDGMTGDAGAQGKIFSNVELLAKDSLFIFIEVTSDVASANPTDFLYTDQIQFSNVSGGPQTVELVTLIQDAYFIRPNRTETAPNTYSYEQINLGLDDTNQQVISVGHTLQHSHPNNGDEYHWKNDKPYVVYGYAFVPDNETLNVDAGARIHFHDNSGLIIAKNGTLKVNGLAPTDHNPENLTNEVIFEGDRLEPNFSDVPGQWGAILSYSIKSDNLINHLTIKNATVGILIQNLALFSDMNKPNLSITNSQIYNCSYAGILARKSTLSGTNLVINYCGQADLACTFGGTYNFTHCTFNNNWNNAKQVAVLLNNYIDTDTTRYVSNLDGANFNNCIIYGSNQNELYLDKKTDQGVTFNYNFNHCLIKFNNTTNNSLYLPNNTTDFPGSTAATSLNPYNPKFKNVASNKLWLSEAWNSTLTNDANFSNFNDILGNPRTGTIALGAYQFVP